jgi:ammonium transporter, Amt family
MDPLTPHLPALVWLLAASALVFFMQAGFAAVEAGAVRHKNSINVALKNVVDLCVSFLAFLVVGYALMFGADASGAGLWGTPTLFLGGIAAADPAGTDVFTAFPMAAFLFQATFCATAATIVSGGVAERCRFLAYVLVTAGMALVIYPLYGHWTWGGGWLADLGFHDFAGSSVVHLLGAGVTAAGLLVLGPRTGRFDADGRPRPIPASSMPLMAVGVCVLAFGWIGFNGGSAPLGPETATIIVKTLTAGCAGGVAALLATWALRGVPAADLVLNGVLGGLVAITAGANCLSLPSAALVGLAGGLAVVAGAALLERWRLDDAVGAVPVHGAAGVVGVLGAGLLVDPAWLAANRPGMGQGSFFLVQALGVTACLLWAVGAGWLLWWLVGRITSLRVGPDEERVGMNYSEHQVPDPVAELVRAATGRAGAVDTDGLGSSDLLPLARGIQDLLERHAALRRHGAGWADATDTLAAAVREQALHLDGAGSAFAAACAATRTSLGHISAALSGRTDPGLAVVADLIIHLDLRLARCEDDMPRSAVLRDRLQRAGGDLGDLAAAMRAGRQVRA